VFILTVSRGRFQLIPQRVREVVAEAYERILERYRAWMDALVSLAVVRAFSPQAICIVPGFQAWLTA
jgi:hypothetical protein